MLIRSPQPRLSAKKFFLLLLALLVLIFIVFTLSPDSKKSSSLPETQPIPTRESENLPDPALPAGLQGFGTTPYPSTVPPRISAAPQKLVFADPEGKYRILYTEYNQLYTITILDPQFDKYRQLAEQRLLQILKITTDQACRLKVIISSPAHISPDSRPILFSTLSFCPS